MDGWMEARYPMTKTNTESRTNTPILLLWIRICFILWHL